MSDSENGKRNPTFFCSSFLFYKLSFCILFQLLVTLQQNAYSVKGLYQNHF